MQNVAEKTEMGEALTNFRLSRRMTQKELAGKLGVERDTYKNWEYGQNDPPREILEKLRSMGFRQALAVKEHAIGLDRWVRTVTALPQAPIRNLGYVGGGEESSADPYEGQFFVPIEFAAEDHGGFELEGNSMLPFLHPGDVLIFKLTYQPKIGRINIMVAPGDSKPVAKQLEMREGRLRVESFNADYQPFEPDGTRFMGFLIGIIGDRIRVGPQWDGIGRDFLEGEFSSRLP